MNGHRQPNQSRGGHSSQDVAGGQSGIHPLLEKINLESITPDLFDEVAEKVAKKLKDQRSRSNKPSQLRRFYDEICMWASKDENQFDNNLPFIRMLNAKAAYAQGRENLVNEDYVKLLRHCLKQVKDHNTLTHFKFFMEAVMGFYKRERPKD